MFFINKVVYYFQPCAVSLFYCRLRIKAYHIIYDLPTLIQIIMKPSEYI